MSDEVFLTVDGKDYLGWNDITITRGLKESTATFDIAVSERWAGQSSVPWQILPFKQVAVSIGGDKVLTGWVESYEPSYTAGDHTVHIRGRSKTCDLVDCMPEINSEFSGSKLDTIARAVCAPFSVGVIKECDVGDALPDATLEKNETAFAFLEKLARLRSVLLTDDVDGNLVITQAGKQGVSSGALIEGENILSAHAKLTANERFQQYAVLSQTPLAHDGKDAHNQIIGKATDSGCPRYRRLAEIAEHPSDQAHAEKRAKWRSLHNIGSSIEATITVTGWRQADASGNPQGKLWSTNMLVPVKSPMLALDKQLLVGRVVFQFDEKDGRRTELTLAPQEAFTPEPADSGSKKSAPGKTDPVWTPSGTMVA